MSKKLKITMTIEDESGEMIVNRTSERAVPYIEELVSQGFRGAFHAYETAVLESRKEVSDEVTSEYFGLISEKKPRVKWEIAEVLRQKDTQ